MCATAGGVRMQGDVGWIAEKGHWPFGVRDYTWIWPYLFTLNTAIISLHLGAGKVRLVGKEQETEYSGPVITLRVQYRQHIQYKLGTIQLGG